MNKDVVEKIALTDNVVETVTLKENVVKLSDGTLVEKISGDIENILVEKLGHCIADITYEQLYVIEKLLKDGWEICSSFYGERNEEMKNDVTLRSGFSWFKFNGIHKDALERFDVEDDFDHRIHKSPKYLVSYVLCINYKNGELILYNNEATERCLIGKFNCLSDLKKCLRHIEDFIPSRLILTNQVKMYDTCCESGDLHNKVYLNDFDISIGHYADRSKVRIIK